MCNAVSILAVLQEKLRKLLFGDDPKATQKIVISLGHICFKETSPSHLNIALDMIFSLSRSKVTMHFCFSLFFLVGKILQGSSFIFE